MVLQSKVSVFQQGSWGLGALKVSLFIKFVITGKFLYICYVKAFSCGTLVTKSHKTHTAYLMGKMRRNTCGKQERTAALWDATATLQDEAGMSVYPGFWMT